MNKRMQHIPIIKDEFIGKQVIISDCSDPSLIDITGVIVDETKNTFIIDVNGQLKCVAKNIAEFSIKKHNTLIKVKGSRISFRPEDRIKKAR